MRIAVCVKQVPDTTKVEIDPETRTLKREGVESVLNPLDAFAVEQALRVREAVGGAVTAFSMGPPQAEEVLRHVMACGVDHAVLVCGREFAGSDTWATSLALSRALALCGPWDLILCGKQAVDGDTAHVGPQIAAHLDLPQVTFVRALREMTPTHVVVERLADGCVEVISAPWPVLLTVLKDLNEPRWPNLEDLVRSRGVQVRRVGARDLGVETSSLGLEGSPTRVVDLFSPQHRRKGNIFDENFDEGFSQLLAQLRADGSGGSRARTS